MHKSTILHVQVRKIAGYDEDFVFLMVPDESEFGRRVPLVIGSCTIGRIINVIQESEIDCLSTPWATARMAQLLSCQKSMAVFSPGRVGKAWSEGTSGGPQEVDVDELVMVRESVCLRPFQTKITEGWVKPLFGDMANMMITLLKVGEGQPWEARPLPPGLHVFHAYMYASKTAATKFHSWLGTCLTVTSSLRRECHWHESCWHHRCHLWSCCWRWKPL